MPYTAEQESRVQSNLNLTAGQVYKQSFYYTIDEINKLAASVGDKQEHQAHKPVRHGYLESSILSKALPHVLLQRDTICIRKNINFHKLMYINISYIALVNIREVQDNGLVLLNIAVLENDSDKLVASGEALVISKDKSSGESLGLKRGLRIGMH